jgi:hypothetical protein
MQVSKRVGLAVEGFLSLCRHVQTAGPCVIDVQSKDTPWRTPRDCYALSKFAISVMCMSSRMDGYRVLNCILAFFILFSRSRARPRLQALTRQPPAPARCRGWLPLRRQAHDERRRHR